MPCLTRSRDAGLPSRMTVSSTILKASSASARPNRRDARSGCRLFRDDLQALVSGHAVLPVAA
jgi:hypothetical protein